MEVNLISDTLIHPVEKIKIKNFHVFDIHWLDRTSCYTIVKVASLNVMMALNVAGLSSQYGRRLQLKCLHYQKPTFRNASLMMPDSKKKKKKKKKTAREKSRECCNHKPQPFPDTKRKRKLTNPNKQESNKHMKSNKISSLFPKRGNCTAKRTEKHKNKMTQGKT